jgi:aspartyl-tRNA synthetase
MQNRIQIKNLHNFIEKEVSIAGWVDARRDHGKLIFLDLRDATGKAQMVALPNYSQVHELAENLRPEWVIAVDGGKNDKPRFAHRRY